MKYVILLIALFIPISMIAQSNDSYISIGIGASFPLGDFSSDSPINQADPSGFAETGININIFNYGQTFENNLGVHTRVFYNQNAIDIGELDELLDLDDWQQLGIIVGPTYSLNLQDKVTFDLKPGVGFAGTRLPDLGSGSTSSSDFTWSMGVGMRVYLLDYFGMLLDVNYTSTEATFNNFDYNQPVDVFSTNLGLFVSF